MVKSGDVEGKEDFCEFFDVVEEFGVVQDGGKIGEPLDDRMVVRAKKKMMKKVGFGEKGLRLVQNVAWMSRNGENIEGLSKFLDKTAKKVLLETKNQEKVDKGTLISYFKEFTQFFRTPDEISEKFLSRLIKALKNSKKIIQDKEFLKALIAHILKNTEKEKILSAIKALGNSINDFWITLIFTYATHLEQSKLSPQDLIEVCSTTGKNSLKNSLKQTLDLLTTYSSVEAINSLTYFRVLLLVTDLILFDTNQYSQHLPKATHILFKSLNFSLTPKNCPQQVQILERLTELEIKSLNYFPGILPIAYGILGSQIFFKRSKSLRVTQVDFRFKLNLSAEEQTSEVYKQSLLERIVYCLQTHFKFLRTKFNGSLSVVKVQIEQLQASLPPSISARLKPLIKI